MNELLGRFLVQTVEKWGDRVGLAFPDATTFMGQATLYYIPKVGKFLVIPTEGKPLERATISLVATDGDDAKRLQAAIVEWPKKPAIIVLATNGHPSAA